MIRLIIWLFGAEQKLSSTSTEKTSTARKTSEFYKLFIEFKIFILKK